MTNRVRCLEELRVRDRRRRRASVIVTGPDGARRRDREGHGQAVVAGRSRRRRRAAAARSAGSRPRIPRPRCPSRGSPAASALMRSLSLTRSSPAPRTVERPAGRHHRRERRQGGDLVDDAGHLGRRDREAAFQSPHCDAQRPGRFRGRRVVDRSDSTRAPARRRISSTPVRVGFSPTPSIVTSAAGRPGGQRGPEGGAGDVAGHGEVACRRGCRRRGRSRRLTRRVTRQPNVSQAPLRMIARRRGLLDRGQSLDASSPASSTQLLTWALGTSG